MKTVDDQQHVRDKLTLDLYLLKRVAEYHEKYSYSLGYVDLVETLPLQFHKTHLMFMNITRGL